MNFLKQLEKYLETVLWNSRFMVLIAVISSMLAAIGIFIVGATIMIKTIIHILTTLSEEEMKLMGEAAVSISEIVAVIDTFLLATVLFIFALGLYELFISKIDDLEEQKEEGGRPNWLVIHDLDDLKEKLAKVIILILIVTFYEKVVQIHWDTPVNMLFLAIAIALVALTFFLLKEREKH